MNENASCAGFAPARSRKQGVPAGAPIVTRQVHEALAGDDEVRALVLGCFRVQGGDLDAWRRSDREVMADAFTRGEDAVELRRTSPARDALRVALRRVRRALEAEAVS